MSASSDRFWGKALPIRQVQTSNSLARSRWQTYSWMLWIFTKIITQIKKGSAEQTNEGMEVTLLMLRFASRHKLNLKKLKWRKPLLLHKLLQNCLASVTGLPTLGSVATIKNKVSLLSSVLGTGGINHSIFKTWSRRKTK